MSKNLHKNKGFDEIYLAYYPKLVRFSKEYVLSKPDAENIVQDCFIYLWEQKEILPSINNINAFLFRLVKNKCIDFLRYKLLTENKKQTIQDTFFTEYQFKLHAIESFDDHSMTDENIEEIIYKAIDTLPEKCRDIFILNKIEGLKYEDIANKMNLSKNTVRNQISIALKKMKSELKDYSPLLNFLIS